MKTFSFNRLTSIHGANKIVEIHEDRVLRRLMPPTSLTNGLDAVLKPISSNNANTSNKTPPLWSDTSNHETIR